MPFVVDNRGMKPLQRVCVAALGLLATLATACGDSSSSRNLAGPDTDIDAAALAGDWSGTIDDLNTTGTLRLRLVGPQAEGGYTGTWSAVFADSSLNRQGTLSAVTSLSVIGPPRLPFLTVHLVPISPPPCTSIFGERRYMLELGVSARNRMVGNGEFGGCDGRINLVRVQLTR